MASFPLLLLPFVAMEHVLCMLSPFELIDVSLASSRAKKAVKNFSKTQQKFSVTFLNNWLSIVFCRGQMLWIYAILNQEQANRDVQINWNGNTGEVRKKRSEEPLKDIMKWFDHAREVLNCKINNLTLTLYSSSIENRQTIDWIAAQNQTMEIMTISNNYKESDDDLKYLMERIHVSGDFFLKVDRYKDNFWMEIPRKLNYLHIENSEFIEFEQLLSVESPTIILRKSILTSQEINRFLKSWMSCETHLELKALEISISGPDAMNEIMDLPHEKTNDPNLVKAFLDYPHYVDVENDMFTIKQSDEKKRATVTVAPQASFDDYWSFYLIVH
uniref:F-box domain-containing protein n=1 Tax=Caenorhabditis tropicalis TaxID=1561998 RepID=A0A1I7UU02_9PELO